MRSKETQAASYYGRIIRKDACVYCGFKKKFSKDHIHPRSYGGINFWYNYTATCQMCNQSKGSLSVLEFLLGGRNSRISAFGGSSSVTWETKELYYMPDNWYDPLGIYDNPDKYEDRLLAPRRKV